MPDDVVSVVVVILSEAHVEVDTSDSVHSTAVVHDTMTMYAQLNELIQVEVEP